MRTLLKNFVALLLVVGINHNVEAEMAPGTICSYLGHANQLPDGWLICDGSSVLIEQHLELFKVIGWTFGYGHDSTNGTTFCVPDLRGQFLRGVDHGAGVDKDAMVRSAFPNGRWIVGDAVGSFQQFATASPKAKFETMKDGGHSHSNGNYNRLLEHKRADTITRDVDDIDATGSEPALHRSAALTEGPHSHGLKGGDSETRPTNVSVLWLIKTQAKTAVKKTIRPSPVKVRRPAAPNHLGGNYRLDPHR